MGEHRENEIRAFSLEEHRERMAQIGANLEKCSMMLAELERRVDELEEKLLRRDRFGRKA